MDTVDSDLTGVVLCTPLRVDVTQLVTRPEVVTVAVTVSDAKLVKEPDALSETAAVMEGEPERVTKPEGLGELV